ncbi:MAG: acyl-CoA desaturase [Acidobacteriota bacterium]|nr:MAG: acyl-CoA desaturase [Acidobacteriota bacterium]
MSSSLLRRVNLWSGIPLAGFHLGCLLVIWVGVSWPAVIACAAVYWTQIFGVSAGYHRYFAHRSFRTSRWLQFLLAVLGATSAQMGPLWWSSHHRRHHQFADTEDDIHSPIRTGFLWSHLGWILSDEYKDIDPKYVKDWLRFPELVWLDRLRYLPPLGVGVILFVVGSWIAAYRPQWGASGWQLVVWGSFVGTTLCYQVTFCINSVTHLIGRRRFETHDNSRNVWFLALLTNGEGWHNNHHRYPSSERQGFFWWELDVTHYLLQVLKAVGLVWGIKEPPPVIYEETRARPSAAS